MADSLTAGNQKRPFCVTIPDTRVPQRLRSETPHRRRTSLTLEIRGLSKRYPNGVQALNNLSLTIGNNMFGLLGPNGAGKSTLMRTIATLQDPDSGTILLNGLDVVANKDAVRKQLGYLPQEFGVYPKMSAADMLLHLAVLKGVRSS